MFAVVEIGGKQYKVSPKSKIQVELQDAEPGKTVDVKTVMLQAEEDGSKVEIGKPYLDSTLKFKVLEHIKGEKITVFKKKPKKRYQRTQGHRQNYTILETPDFK